MKDIIVSYVIMLLMCALVGIIVALMCCYSMWCVFLFLFPAVLAWMPLIKLRREVHLNPGFSILLFVVASLLWLIIAVVITNYMDIESFLSVMFVVTAWSALLMTVRLISLVHVDKYLKGLEKMQV